MYFLITLITVPILLISNYFLGLFSLKIYNKTYKKHIIIENFDSNITSFNKYLVSIIFIVLVIISLFSIINDISVQRFLAGYFIIFPILGTSLNLYNILNFYYSSKYPDSLNGKVNLSHKYSKQSSSFLILSFLIPFMILAIVTNDFFAYGAAVSVFISGILLAKS